MKYALGKAALIGLGIFAFAALPARAGQLGTTSASGLTPPAAPALATCSTQNPCSPVAIGQGLSLASGGCGLRNRGDCAIDISGSAPPALGALVFWSMILPNGMSTSDPRVSTIFLTHGEFGLDLKGSVLGTGPNPCWLGNGEPIVVYVAAIFTGDPRLSVFNDESSPAAPNGDYHVFLEPGGSGLTTGEDPWDGHVIAPLAEGVSIVVVGSGRQKVAVWGGSGFSGATFAGGTQAYALQFAPFAPAPTGGPADFVSMWADGQRGASYTFFAAANKAMIINGVNVAGVGSTINPDSGLNGDSANPLPQLWDSSEIDVGSMGVFSHSPGPGVMSITVGGSLNDDCITPIAHALAYN